MNCEIISLMENNIFKIILYFKMLRFADSENEHNSFHTFEEIGKVLGSFRKYFRVSEDNSTSQNLFNYCFISNGNASCNYRCFYFH